MVNYSHNDLFLKDSTITNILVYEEESGNTFGNDKIYFEELELNESISFLPDLNFGSCTSNGITLKVRSDVGNLKGKTITVSLVLNDLTEEPFTLGTYKVISDNLQANEGSRTIEAYDALYDVINTDIADWYNEIYDADEAYTIKNLRSMLLDHFGITEEETTLVNDSEIIEKTIKPSMLSGYDLLSNICELNGVFAHIGRDNVLRYIKLSQENPFTITVDKYVWADYQSFSTAPLDAIQIRQEENDIGGAYPQNIDPVNGLVIEDNFLVYGKTTLQLNEIARKIYNQIGSITYVPIDMLAKGNPSLEVGDCVRIQTTEGDYITTYVLERSLEGIQTMADRIEAKGNEERDENINTIQSKFMQLKGQTATLEHTVEGLRSTVTTIEGNYTTKSELEQTSELLSAQIESLQREIDGDTSIYYVTEAPTLLNYPAWDFTYNIPCNNTVQLRDDLQFEYTDEYYRKNQRALVYDTTTGMAYRFTKYNGVWGWQEIADTETALILQKISALEMTTEGITTQVAEIEENFTTRSEVQSSLEQTATQIESTVSSTYETKSNATSTRNSLQTQITQNATQINLKVSQGQVSSQLSLETGQVTISGNRLVVDSTNFKLNRDGQIIASGTFTTNSDSSGNTARLTAGGFKLYNANNTNYSNIGGIQKSGQVAQGIALSVGSGGQIALADNNLNIYYSMNNGWNLSNYTQRHLFFGDMRAVDSLYFGGGDANLKAITYDGQSSIGCTHGFYAYGSIGCSGTKYRVVETEHYGKRGLNAFETATANFGDVGSGVVEENGLCEVPIEDIFSETVDLFNYQVLITRTSEKETSWVEKKQNCFIVHGEPGASFDWMLIAPQKDYADVRLKEININ